MLYSTFIKIQSEKSEFNPLNQENESLPKSDFHQTTSKTCFLVNLLNKLYNMAPFNDAFK